jgi:hypothetical protein
LAESAISLQRMGSISAGNANRIPVSKAPNQEFYEADARGALALAPSLKREIWGTRLFAAEFSTVELACDEEVMHPIHAPSQPTEPADELVFGKQTTEEYKNENGRKRLKPRVPTSDDGACQMSLLRLCGASLLQPLHDRGVRGKGRPQTISHLSRIRMSAKSSPFSATERLNL